MDDKFTNLWHDFMTDEGRDFREALVDFHEDPSPDNTLTLIAKYRALAECGQKSEELASLFVMYCDAIKLLSFEQLIQVLKTRISDTRRDFIWWARWNKEDQLAAKADSGPGMDREILWASVKHHTFEHVEVLEELEERGFVALDREEREEFEQFARVVGRIDFLVRD